MNLDGGRVSRRDAFRLWQLAEQASQPVTTWTTPFQRAQEALRIAGEAMELKEQAVVDYALTVHLRYVRVLIEQFGSETELLRAVERRQVASAIDAADRMMASPDWGGPG